MNTDVLPQSVLSDPSAEVVVSMTVLLYLLRKTGTLFYAILSTTSLSCDGRIEYNNNNNIDNTANRQKYPTLYPRHLLRLPILQQPKSRPHLPSQCRPMNPLFIIHISCCTNQRPNILIMPSSLNPIFLVQLLN